MASLHPYHGQQAVLSTIHGKEEVIAPVLAKMFGIQLLTANEINTDTLGTFSGEVERKYPMLETLRLKLEMGMQATQLDLAIGTEGSFGPDPRIPFIAQHTELMMWRDRKRGIEVVEQLKTNDTNYEQMTTQQLDEQVEAYLERVQFPSHKLIVVANERQSDDAIWKGVGDRDTLAEAIRCCAQQSPDGLVIIQTDMRAMMNPTRLRVIGDLAIKLADKLTKQCEQCGSPGWGLIDVVRGSPCDWCGRPTKQVRGEIHGCPACHHQLQTLEKNDKQTASPAFCDWCNP